MDVLTQFFSKSMYQFKKLILIEEMWEILEIRYDIKLGKNIFKSNSREYCFVLF